MVDPPQKVVIGHVIIETEIIKQLRRCHLHPIIVPLPPESTQDGITYRQPINHSVAMAEVATI